MVLPADVGTSDRYSSLALLEKWEADLADLERLVARKRAAVEELRAELNLPPRVSVEDLAAPTPISIREAIDRTLRRANGAALSVVEITDAVRAARIRTKGTLTPDTVNSSLYANFEAMNWVKHPSPKGKKGVRWSVPAPAAARIESDAPPT